MKTILQILLAALIVMACARGGEAFWRYYNFEDAVEQELRFGNAKTTGELHKRVHEIAQEHEVPVDYENIAVEPRNGQTFVSASYVETIKLIPGFYTRSHEFEVKANMRVVRPLKVDEAVQR